MVNRKVVIALAVALLATPAFADVIQCGLVSPNTVQSLIDLGSGGCSTLILSSGGNRVTLRDWHYTETNTLTASQVRLIAFDGSTFLGGPWTAQDGGTISFEFSFVADNAPNFSSFNLSFGGPGQFTVPDSAARLGTDIGGGSRSFDWAFSITADPGKTVDISGFGIVFSSIPEPGSILLFCSTAPWLAWLIRRRSAVD